MWDSHCHLDDPRIIAELPSLLQRATEAGITGMIVAGISPERWPTQHAVISTDPRLFGTYGLHPWYAATLSPERLLEDLQKLDSLLATVPAIGLGEIGLDRSPRCPPDTWDAQERAFRSQLALARERDLPVVLHVVRAYLETFALLRRDGLPKPGGMLHAFGSSAEIAQEAQTLGLYLSFGGSLLAPQAKKLQKAAASVAPERLLIETDSPDRLPHPLASLHRMNEPAFLPFVLRHLAQIRDTHADDLANLTSSNTQTLFSLKKEPHAFPPS